MDIKLQSILNDIVNDVLQENGDVADRAMDQAIGANDGEVPVARGPRATGALPVSIGGLQIGSAVTPGVYNLHDPETGKVVGVYNKDHGKIYTGDGTPGVDVNVGPSLGQRASMLGSDIAYRANSAGSAIKNAAEAHPYLTGATAGALGTALAAGAGALALRKQRRAAGQ